MLFFSLITRVTIYSSQSADNLHAIMTYLREKIVEKR